MLLKVQPSDSQPFAFCCGLLSDLLAELVYTGQCHLQKQILTTVVFLEYITDYVSNKPIICVHSNVKQWVLTATHICGPVPVPWPIPVIRALQSLKFCPVAKLA